jgi:hypothetical protein
MLDAIRFVASAVARKDFVADLQHFKIKDSRITGYNGAMALSSDIDVDLDVQPKADKFLAAIKACQGTIALNVTPTGKLAIKAGKFKSFIDCLQEESPHFVLPEGEEVEVGPLFLEGLKALQPAMGIDASRPWGMGIKLAANSMFATNNVMLVEYHHGHPVPIDVVIPAAAVNEILRIGEMPTRVQTNGVSVTFWFGPKRWLRTNVINGAEWPTDKIDAIFSRISHATPVEVSISLKEAVEALKPFLEESSAITLDGITARTVATEGAGASYEVALPGFEEGKLVTYGHKQLEILCEIATKVDLTLFPMPAVFFGERLRGVVAGMAR